MLLQLEKMGGGGISRQTNIRDAKVSFVAITNVGKQSLEDAKKNRTVG